MNSAEMKEMHYKSQTECKADMSNMIWWTLVFLMPTIVMIEIHFCLVIYTHWKNSHLSKNQGGLASDQETNAFA